MHCGTLLNSVIAVGFFEKKNQVVGKVSIFTVNVDCDLFWISPTYLCFQCDDVH